MKEQKRCYKSIDIVSYALKVSVNGVTCVIVVHFRSLNIFGQFHGNGITIHNIFWFKMVIFSHSACIYKRNLNMV